MHPPIGSLFEQVVGRVCTTEEQGHVPEVRDHPAGHAPFRTVVVVAIPVNDAPEGEEAQASSREAREDEAGDHCLLAKGRGQLAKERVQLAEGRVIWPRGGVRARIAI